MIRTYARENAHQRGNLGTAQAGTVASAIKYLAKMLMTNATPDFRSRLDMNVVRQRLTDERGLGEPLITEFLADIPGMKAN